jgi:hypothetical protein
MKIKPIGKLLNFFLGKDVIAITLCPFGIYIRKGKEKSVTINHEKIHWKQQLEMLVLFFYLWYIIEWFLRLFINNGDAYRNISFEREAYKNDKNLEYLTNRKIYSWFKYLVKK